MIHLQRVDGLGDVIGILTPAGPTIGRALSNDRLFSITLVPELETYGLIAAIGLLAAALWRVTSIKLHHHDPRPAARPV